MRAAICLSWVRSRKMARVARQAVIWLAALAFLPALVLKTYKTAWDLQPAWCPAEPEAVSYPEGFLSANYSMDTFPWLSSPHLGRMMTREVHAEYMSLMESLDRLLSAHEIEYVLEGASLMGSYIMHDTLPWDDDIDIWVNLRHLPKIKRLFADPELRKQFEVTSFWSYRDEYTLDNLNSFPKGAADAEFYVYRYQAPKHNLLIPTLTNYVNAEFHMLKFFFPNGTRVGHWPFHYIIDRPFKWPFIDIFFYTQNDTHVWNYEAPNKINMIKKGDFYPLHKRPLGRLWLPVPHDPNRLMKDRSGHFECYRSEHSHQDDKIHLKSPICCSALLPYYPVVYPKGTNQAGNQVEELSLAGKVIRTVEIKGERPAPHSKRPHDI